MTNHLKYKLTLRQREVLRRIRQGAVLSFDNYDFILEGTHGGIEVVEPTVINRFKKLQIMDGNLKVTITQN